MKDLLECPWCLDTAGLRIYHEDEFKDGSFVSVSVYCVYCECAGPRGQTEEEAKAEWNLRKKRVVE